MIATLPSADDPKILLGLDDEALIERIQQQTLRFFWDGAERASLLAPDRRERDPGALDDDDRVAIGGSGFGVMALIVAVERGWLPRESVVERLDRMITVLVGAPRNNGAFSFVREWIEDVMEKLGRSDRLKYVGRPAAASPACGYLKIHEKEQKFLVSEALSLEKTAKKKAV